MNFNHDTDLYILRHIMPQEDVLSELERETHLTCLYPRMLSGHLQGKVMYMLCKMIRPQRILELGTYTGYSAISMALALDPSAVLHTIEVRDEQEEIIRKYISKAGLEQVIIPHFGHARDIVPALNETFDLVFIDADKREYPQYYELVIDRLKPGGYIIADNILWDGKVVDPASQLEAQTQGITEFNRMVHADPRVENVIFPFRDGMMVVRKK